MELKIIVEKHSEGYVAYPLGLKGVVVGEGDRRSSTKRKISNQIPHRNFWKGRL